MLALLASHSIQVPAIATVLDDKYRIAADYGSGGFDDTSVMEELFRESQKIHAHLLSVCLVRPLLAI